METSEVNLLTLSTPALRPLVDLFSSAKPMSDVTRHTRTPHPQSALNYVDEVYPAFFNPSDPTCLSLVRAETTTHKLSSGLHKVSEQEQDTARDTELNPPRQRLVKLATG